MLKFILSYVNTPKETVHYDKTYFSFIKLMSLVEQAHPDFTSYQVIVMRQGNETKP